MNNVAEKILELSIARDFTEVPGPRFTEEGKFSGEEFRKSLLRSKFDEALSTGALLRVDLDGTYGYPPSFLEEAFGGLVRDTNQADVLRVLRFKSDEEPLLMNDIESYIRKAGS